VTVRLEGKVAIVPGAASGIGAATAALMVAEGAKVVLADLDATRAAKIANRLGDDAVAQTADVRDEAAVAALVETALQRFGRLDVLHNNAVAVSSEDSDVIRCPDDVWRGMFDVVVMAAVYGCRHAIPAMTATGGGAIINTSSGAARVPTGAKIAYGTAKAGLTLSIYTASMFGVEGIRSNVVSPGFVLSEGTKALMSAEAIDQFSSSAAAGRLCNPDDIADVVVFLASDAARYVSGQIITVNGGGTRGMAW
jgi:NAD(P)-dependent dehydrogenase (short-subunit alcohol dehydrogenase family)